MSNIVCNFSPLRFLPYRETGEFVNVGMVVHCPQTGYFGFRLETGRSHRITNFFPALDPGELTAALEGAARELQRVAASHQPRAARAAASPEEAEEGVKWFAELARRREGILHFGEIGSLLASSPEAALDNLFERFVKRQFAPARESQPC